jgi:steroid 5-alpha reductase family enzyme
MDKGLWSLTRHPNYFGDSAMWFGIFLIAITDISGLWTIVGPSLMTFFLVFVSGVKMLESKYKGREDYDRYKKRTSIFVPWFPKKS